MRADFFVHPGYSSEWNSGVGEQYLNYERRLQMIASGSPLPVHIQDSVRGPYRPTFDWHRFFDGSQYFTTSPQSGELENDGEAQRVVEFLKDYDINELVIHGSYLEICVHDFIAHLEDTIGHDNVARGNGLEPTLWMHPQNMSGVSVVGLGYVLSARVHTEEDYRPPESAIERAGTERRIQAYTTERTVTYGL